MIVRRWPVVAVVVAALVGLVVFGIRPNDEVETVFSQTATPWMPAVQPDSDVGSTWFCPGVPAAGETGTAGEVVVVNPTAEPTRAVITALDAATSAEAAAAASTAAPESVPAATEAASPSTVTVDIPAFGTHRQNIGELVSTPFAAVVVEVAGGGAFVEQVATAPVGDASASSIATCATSPSSTWYFATGNTEGDSVDTLVISNPYDHSAVIDISVDTPRGPRQIADALPVAAHSVRTVELTERIADQPWIGVVVEAGRGGVVVGRSQVLATDTLSGYSMTLGSPTLNTHWWFAYGVKGQDVSMRYAIYNPGDEAVTVNPVAVGTPLLGDPVPALDVPARSVVELDPNELTTIGEGVFSMVITAPPDQPVVVERIVSRTIEGVTTSGQTMGGLNRPDGSNSTTWYVGAGFGEATTGGLQLLNTASTDAVVTVSAVRPEGLTPVPGMTDVAVPANATHVFDVTDPSAVGVPLVITSSTPIVVERVVPREAGAQGRVVTWAVPTAA